MSETNQSIAKEEARQTFLGGRVSLSSITGSTGVCSLPVAKRLCRQNASSLGYLTIGGSYYVFADKFQKVFIDDREAKRKKSLATTKANGRKRKAINKLVKAGAAYADAKTQVESRVGATVSPKA
mgnify:CR=1 FL=1